MTETNNEYPENWSKWKRFWLTPWGNEKLRSSAITLMGIGFFVVVELLIMFAFPDELTTLLSLLLILATVCALLSYMFILKCASYMSRYKNLDIIRAFKITFLHVRSGLRGLPFDIAYGMGIISHAMRDKLLDEKNDLVFMSKVSKPIRRFTKWKRKSIKIVEKIEKLKDTAVQPSYAVLSMNARNVGLSSALANVKHFESISEYLESLPMKPFRSSARTAMVILPYVTGDTRHGIVGIVKLVDGFLDGTSTVIALDTSKVPVAEIAALIENDDSFYVAYDQENALSDYKSQLLPGTIAKNEENMNPTISSRSLYPKNPGKMQNVTNSSALNRMERTPIYVWSGRLPQGFINSAIKHELYVADNAMATLFNYSSLTASPEAKQLIGIASLGQASLPDVVKRTDHRRDMPIEDLFTSVRYLEYDANDDDTVGVFKSFSQEVKDIVEIWQHAFSDAGIQCQFVPIGSEGESYSVPYTMHKTSDPITDDECRKLFEAQVNDIGKLIGIESFITAYYEGVPLIDIIG